MPGQQVNNEIKADIWRIIDSSANRANEGIRTSEEYVRFILNDAFLAGQLKQLRHDIALACEAFPRLELLGSRDTSGDVGTSISTDSEGNRASALKVAVAASIRVQQALRCLEEYSKIVDTDAATQFEACRYRSYTIFAAIESMASRRRRLSQSHLYVLVDGNQSEEAMLSYVHRLVDGGTDVIQLRDKGLSDRALYDRAKLLADALRPTTTVFIVNDRPDIALAVNADGVHIGQDELPYSAVRKIVGADAIVGVSTHSIEQARQAVMDGADYIGCGPTFPSKTKTFDLFVGTEFLRAVAEEISLPAFAIGGISLDNVASVLETGFSKVAVTRAVDQGEKTKQVAMSLKDRLLSGDTHAR